MSRPRVDAAVVAHAAASSTTPLEAAVVLESAGVNDRIAADRFGAPDVFALAELAIADPGRGVSEPVRSSPPRGLAAPGGRWWFHLRGLLYAVPAVVALSLLPAGDPVASGLVLAGLLAAWASGYGVSSIAWARLGNLDLPGMKRFLRRALLVGTLLGVLGSVGAVLAVLLLTATTSVDLNTVALLTAQFAYLLGASALLLLGKELWLLAAQIPAAVGVYLALREPRAGPVSAFGAPTGLPDRDLLWPAASVLVVVVLTLIATRGGRRRTGSISPTDRGRAITEVARGLFVAVLVLFPAIDQLVDPGFDPLPLSVTLVAIPLVLGMGFAETLIVGFRRRTTRILEGTGSAVVFARRARACAIGHIVSFAAALAVTTAVVGSAVILSGTAWDDRMGLLAADYLILGTALFAATMLDLLGRTNRIVGILSGAVTALAAFLALTEHTPSAMAIIWHIAVGTVALVALVTGAIRAAGEPVRYR